MKEKSKMRQIREKRGISFEMAAAHVGVTRATISNWEDGRVDPPFSKIIKLAKYYDVDINEFTG